MEVNLQLWEQVKTKMKHTMEQKVMPNYSLLYFIYFSFGLQMFNYTSYYMGPYFK